MNGYWERPADRRFLGTRVRNIVLSTDEDPQRHVQEFQ